MQIKVQARSLQGDPLLRKVASLDICRARRLLRRAKADERCIAATNRLALPNDDKKGATAGRVYGIVDKASGDAYFTPEQIQLVARDFYEKLFSDESEVLPEWIWKRWSLDELDRFEEINGFMIKELILSFLLGRHFLTTTW